MVAPKQTTYDLAAAQFLREEAKRRRITQAELGRRASIAPAPMGKYWRGDVSMTLGTLRKLLTALGLESFSEAFEEIDRIQVTLEESEGQ